jgi:hypothetical protein
VQGHAAVDEAKLKYSRDLRSGASPSAVALARTVYSRLATATGCAISGFPVFGCLGNDREEAPMTARKIAIAVLLCGVAIYFAVTWGIDRFRARGAEPEPEPEPEPDRVEDARFATTADADGAGDLVAWRTAFASADIPLGAVVSVGDFGADADALTVRQRGDVVASEMTVVGHRADLPPRTLVAYVGDTGDEIELAPVTLLVRVREG